MLKTPILPSKPEIPKWVSVASTPRFLTLPPIPIPNCEALFPMASSSILIGENPVNLFFGCLRCEPPGGIGVTSSHPGLSGWLLQESLTYPAGIWPVPSSTYVDPGALKSPDFAPSHRLRASRRSYCSRLQRSVPFHSPNPSDKIRWHSFALKPGRLYSLHSMIFLQTTTSYLSRQSLLFCRIRSSNPSLRPTPFSDNPSGDRKEHCCWPRHKPTGSACRIDSFFPRSQLHLHLTQRLPS